MLVTGRVQAVRQGRAALIIRRQSAWARGCDTAGTSELGVLSLTLCTSANGLPAGNNRPIGAGRRRPGWLTAACRFGCSARLSPLGFASAARAHQPAGASHRSSPANRRPEPDGRPEPADRSAAVRPSWATFSARRFGREIPRRGHDVHAATLCGGCCSWFAYDIRSIENLGRRCGPGRDGSEPSRSQARKSGVPRFASAETTAACAAILPRPRPRSARTTRVSFMTRKGTTADRPAGAAATRETGPGTTILRRH